MLKEFSITNYKSINEETTISMEADLDRVSEHPEHVVPINNNKLLKICSMYGPNGGGKSNILKALWLLKNVVTGNPFRESGNCSCVFSEDKVTEFVSFFVTNKYEFGYKVRFTCFANDLVMEDGIRHISESSTDIIEEQITCFDEKTGEYKLICSRDETGNITTYTKTIPDKSVFKTIGSSLSVLKFFYEFFHNANSIASGGLNALFELYEEISSIVVLPNVINSRTVYYAPLNGDLIEANKKELIKLLDAADIHIEDIAVEKTRPFNKIYFIRKIMLGNKIVRKPIEISEESMGTQKVFRLLIRFLAHKGRNAIFLGDDINAYLHPKLLAAIIDLFNSDTESRSQLIFNSHDIINMNNKLFRRDEIWFVYRDDGYQTNAVPLSNITNYKGKQVRNDASYCKQYLEGKYGADPFIKKGLSWNE